MNALLLVLLVAFAFCAGLFVASIPRDRSIVGAIGLFGLVFVLTVLAGFGVHSLLHQ